ncbi:purine-nucleoside phosphorylase [Buchnera aphidicola]|uniref:purine-nucleoside phosphorylase n=1 Tax=Buchnera aphidicola TaxID=9 RepID=UPI0031B885A8
MNTPHINAKKNDFSELVIMSGDPNRVTYIAENFLKNSIQITNVRSMLGFTGYYQDVLVSVMCHGMGIPSAAIYVEELINFYNVKKIVRVGTCGAVRKDIFLKDIVVAMGACTDSSFNRVRFNQYDFSAIANFDMLMKTMHYAKKMNICIHVGNFFTSDTFYVKDKILFDLLKKYNILGIDMETAGIYSLSAEYNIQSVAICCVSDHLTLNQKISVKDRSYAFDNIIKIALLTLIS